MPFDPYSAVPESGASARDSRSSRQPAVSLDGLLDEFQVTDPAVRERVTKLAGIESGGKMSALGPRIKGGMHDGTQARGALQIMPETAKDYPQYDLADPTDATRAGLHYFLDNLQTFGGNIDAATVAHHAGPGAARRWLKTGSAGTKDRATGLETDAYLRKVGGTKPRGGFDAASAQLESGGFDVDSAQLESGGFDPDSAKLEEAPGIIDKVGTVAKQIATSMAQPFAGEKSVMADSGGQPAPTTAASSFAPVKPEVRAAIEGRWDAATPAQRKAMEGRPDWMGQIARDRAASYARNDSMQSPTIDGVDTRKEGRQRRLVRQGENPQFADRTAELGAQAGVAPGQEIAALGGTVQPSTYDFETKNLFDPNAPRNGLNNPLVRGIAKGGLGMGKAVAGYTQFVGDTLGIDGMAGAGGRAGQALQGKESAIGARGDFLGRNVEGAISSITQQLPMLVAGVKGAKEAAVLGGMAFESFGQEYSDGRAQGQTAAQAATRAGIFAAFEVIGEKFGLKETMLALKGAARGMPTDQIASYLWSALKKEVPGEMLTTTGQFATDKFGPAGVGLTPDATGADYLKQMGDTIAQTILQSGMMGAGTSGVSAGVRHLSGTGSRDAAAGANAARDSAMAAWSQGLGGNTTRAQPATVDAASNPGSSAVAGGSDGVAGGSDVGAEGVAGLAAGAPAVDEEASAPVGAAPSEPTPGVADPLDSLIAQREAEASARDPLEGAVVRAEHAASRAVVQRQQAGALAAEVDQAAAALAEPVAPAGPVVQQRPDGTGVVEGKPAELAALLDSLGIQPRMLPTSSGIVVSAADRQAVEAALGHSAPADPFQHTVRDLENVSTIAMAAGVPGGAKIIAVHRLPAEGRGVVTQGAGALVARVSRALGVRTVFFASPKGRVTTEGAVVAGTKGTVYLNARTNTNVLEVLTHEVDHLIQAEAPALHAGFRDAVASAIDASDAAMLDLAGEHLGVQVSSAMRADPTHALDQLLAHHGRDRAWLNDELHSDVVGFASRQKGFWPRFFRELGRRDVSLLQRVHNILRQALDAATGGLTQGGDFVQVQKMIRDLDTVVRESAKVLAEFAAQNQKVSNAHRSAGPVVASPKASPSRTTRDVTSELNTVLSELKAAAPSSRAALNRKIGQLQRERTTLADAEFMRTRAAVDFGEVRASAARVMFEVAPDPNDAALTEQWNALSTQRKFDVSEMVAKQIMPQVFSLAGVSAMMTQQLGGYLDASNPSFAAIVEDGASGAQLVETAKLAGFALAQDSMMVLADKPFDGSFPTGVITVTLPESVKGLDAVHAVYMKLRAVDPESIQGHTTVGQEMMLAVPAEKLGELHDAVREALPEEFKTRDWEGHMAFPEKQEYDYGSDTPSEWSAQLLSRRQDANRLRAEASRILARELAQDAGARPDAASDRQPRSADVGEIFRRGELFPAQTYGVPRDGSIAVTGFHYSQDAGTRPDAASDRQPRSVVVKEIPRGGDTSAAPSYGTPRDGAIAVTGFHYSQDRRAELDGNKYGTGMSGAEARRLDRWSATPEQRKRVYFYTDTGGGVTPESDVGRHLHTTDLRNIYDGEVDPLGLAPEAQQRRKAGEGPDDTANYFEQLVMARGFDGYYTAKAQDGHGVVVLLGSKHNAVPVAYLGQHGKYRQPGAAEAAAEAPAPEVSPNRPVIQAMLSDRSLPGGAMPADSWGRILKAVHPAAHALLEPTGVFSGAATLYKDELIRKSGVKFSPRRSSETALAPNGKPSKLSEQQWHQVRTPEFKAWFGDWEAFASKPSGVWEDEVGAVSKAVDPETHEPLVLYHGAPEAGFTEFEPARNPRGTAATFFTDNRAIATTYSGRRAPEADLSGETEGQGVYSVFLNIRRPSEEYFEGANWDGSREGQFEVVSGRDEEPVYAEDGTRYFRDKAAAKALAKANPGSKVRDAEEFWQSTNTAVEEALRYGHDGAILHDVVDNGPLADEWESSNVFVVTDGAQIKSAVGNVGTFDPTNPDIRFSPARQQSESLARAFIAASQMDGVFQHEVSSATALKTLVAEVLPQASFRDVTQMYSPPAKRQMFRIGLGGSDAFVTYDPGRNYVWLNVAAQGEGKGGSAIYASVGNWAANNGYAFVGDPDGLSDTGKRRRLENVVSLKLKFPQLDVRLHPSQLAWLDDNFGVTLNLSEHNSLQNLGEFIRASYEVNRQLHPEIQYAEFTPDGRFIDRRTNRDFDFEGLAREHRRDGAAGSVGAPGTATLRRAALAQSVVASGDAEGNSNALEALYALRNQSAPTPKRLKGLLYSPPRNPPPAPTFAAPTLPPSRSSHALDRLVFNLQDRFVDLKEIQQAIREAGRTIRDEFNPYQAETLMHGKAAYRTERFLTGEVEPILKLMKGAGLSIEDTNKYLHARHAEERNEAMAKRNPNQVELDDLVQQAGEELLDAELELSTDPTSGAFMRRVQKAQTRLAALRAAKPWSGTEDERQRLSGMSNTDAQAILTAAHASAKAPVYRRIGDKIDAIAAKTRDEMAGYGLESIETVTAMSDAYQHYVPLHRDMGESDLLDSMGGTGQGFSIRGSQAKRATGSLREVESILANLVAQREATIVRGEKNRVAKALYGLVMENPQPELFTAIRPSMSETQLRAELQAMGLDPDTVETMVRAPTVAAINERTGLAERRVSPQYARLDNAIVLRVNGEDRVVLFNKSSDRAVRLASALRNEAPLWLNPHRGPLPIISGITRYLAAINTQYNPVFGLTNFARDVQGAMLNLQTTPLAGLERSVLGNVPSALRGIWNWERSDQQHPWAKIYEAFMAAGGATGYRDQFASLEHRVEALEKLLNGRPIRDAKGIKQFLDFWSDYNTAIENSVRLAAFQAARDAGMSVAAAADLAKDVTVNFNRKGTQSGGLAGLYAFFNAAVQGSERTMRVINSPAGRKLLAAGVSLGAAQAAIGILMLGKDWDEIPEFERSKNLILPLPWADRKYIKIPMPLGFHAIPNIGRSVVEVAVRQDRLGERALGMVATTIDAFNPLGGGGSVLSTVAPSVVDPVVDLATNTTPFGRPISREDMSSLAKTPGWTRGKESTAAPFRAAAYGLNYATSGGKEYETGLLSPTPEALAYAWGVVAGGLGREVEKIVSFSEATARGDSVPPYKVPVLSRFYGAAGGDAMVRNKYAEAIKDINAAEFAMKRLAKDGKDFDSYLDTAGLAKASRKIQGAISELQHAKLAETDRDRRKELDLEVTALQEQLIDLHEGAKDRKK